MDGKASIESLVSQHLEGLSKIQDHLNQIILGKPKAVSLALTTLLARGHLLIEDVPGVGKTTLARSLAGIFSGSFKRIQFTSDLLPGDVIGLQTYQKSTESFVFHHGALFSNFVLADEVNRASPRTQSALLQAMSEGEVTVDRKTYSLPESFMVIATQNPTSFEGTFPLPESQLDRFSTVLTLGYPAPEAELDLLARGGPQVTDPGTILMNMESLSTIQRAVPRIHCEPDVLNYLYAVIESTRKHAAIQLGASPRAALSLLQLSRAHAFLKGRAYVLPDDVKELAVPSLAHRVTLRTSTEDGENSALLIRSILADVNVPV